MLIKHNMRLRADNRYFCRRCNRSFHPRFSCTKGHTVHPDQVPFSPPLIRSNTWIDEAVIKSTWEE